MGSVSLLGLWRIISAHKWRVILITVAFMLLGVLSAIRGEDTYTADSLIVLEDNTAELTNTLSRDVTTYADSRVAVQVFGSRRVLERVVDDLNLTAIPFFNPTLQAEAPSQPSVLSRGANWLALALFGSPSTDEATEEAASAEAARQALVRQNAVSILEDVVSFEGASSDRLIRVAATTFDPELSAQLANSVSQAFLSDLLQTRLQAFDGVVEQLGRRVVDLRQEVRSKEQALQEFVNSVEFTDPDEVQNRRDSAARLRGQIERVELEIAQNAVYLEQLEALEGQSEDAISTAFDDNPSLARLSEGLGTSPTAPGVASLLAELRQQQASNDLRLSSLSDRLVDLDRQIEEQSAYLLRYQQLEREVEASTEIYNFSVQRLNELSVQSGVESAGGRVVLPADVPLYADGRGLLRNLVLLGLLGLFTGVAWVLIRDATDHTIRDADDVARVLPSLQVLSIPGVSASWLPFANDPEWRWLTSTEPTPYSDAIQRLRAVIMSRADLSRPLVVQVTSDLSSSGKAMVSLGLARGFSMLGKRVLVVDANTHQSGIMSAVLKQPVPETTLQTMVSGLSSIEDTVQHDARLGVDFLMSGRSIDAKEKYELAQALPNIVDVFKETYDFILLDTPPLLAGVDSLVGSGTVDRTVLLVSAGASSQQSIRDSVNQIPKGGAKIDVVAVYGGQKHQHRQTVEYDRKLARL